MCQFYVTSYLVKNAHRILCSIYERPTDFISHLWQVFVTSTGDKIRLRKYGNNYKLIFSYDKIKKGEACAKRKEAEHDMEYVPVTSVGICEE